MRPTRWLWLALLTVSTLGIGACDYFRPAEPEPPSAPTPAIRPGRLNLMAIPEADVYFRGRKVGRTPLVEHSLPAGTHRLELRPVNRSPTRTVTARIRPGQTTRIAVR